MFYHISWGCIIDLMEILADILGLLGWRLEASQSKRVRRKNMFKLLRQNYLYSLIC